MLKLTAILSFVFVLLACSNPSTKDLTPPTLEIVGDTIKITPSSEDYLEVLKAVGCDGYSISIRSGLDENGWGKWITGRKLLFTDKNAFKNYDFSAGILGNYKQIEDGKIKASINFWKNCMDDDLREWLALVDSPEVTYDPSIDHSELEVLGCPFGSANSADWADVSGSGRTITWKAGTTNGRFGWDFSGVDLSDYDRVRIEIESNDATTLTLIMESSDGRNYHDFNFTEPNVFEAELTGANAYWVNEDVTDFDKSKGMQIMLQSIGSTPRETDQHTVVKSIEFLKDVKNENLRIAGASLAPEKAAYVYDEGKIEWQEKGGWVVWNLRGRDLSAYKKVQVVVESDVDVELQLRLFDENKNEVNFGYYSFVTNEDGSKTYTADLCGADASWTTKDGATWGDGWSRRDLVLNVTDENVTQGAVTTVKSVTLVSK